MDEHHVNGPAHAPAVARVDLAFEPSGKSVRVPTGVSVFDAASWNGIAIDSTCGGHGTCKKCKVQVLEGSVPVGRLDSRAFDPEQLADGWRLACVANATCDLRIHVPPLTTRPKAATVGVGRQVILRPSVVKRHITMTEPTLTDQRPDSRRVLDEITDLTENIDPQVLRALPRILRASDFDVTAVVVDDMLVAIEPGDTSDRLFGIACDLGTTTVVATLLDLSTGTPIAVASMLNKQQPFGADVISRISATMLDPNALDKLQLLAHETLAELAAEVCAEGGIDPAEIYEVAIAGNATMTQIALGIDPEPLGVAPFILATETYPTMLASDLGFALNPRARAFLFPALGAYVGGDIIAGALATGMDRDKRLRLFIDIGTNCEIVLGDGERLMATAAPAGPAFEAASIKCGMRAAAGAIEVVTIDDDGVHLQVIGDADPVGLCGSGPRRRGGRAGARRHHRPQRPLHPRGRRGRAPAGARTPPARGQRRAGVRPRRGDRRARRRLPQPARRARAAVREGRHLDRLEAAGGGVRRRSRRHPAGAAGRLLRHLPVGAQRGPHRPGAPASRCCASSAPATSRARARRCRCCPAPNGTVRPP